MRTKIHALVLYFDTFFTTTREPLSPDVPVRLIKDGDVTLAEVWPIAGKPPPKRRASVSPGLKELEEKRVISFSTGPTSQPTHWMQTVFLLKDPICAEEGGCSLFFVLSPFRFFCFFFSADTLLVV